MNKIHKIFGLRKQRKNDSPASLDSTSHGHHEDLLIPAGPMLVRRNAANSYEYVPSLSLPSPSLSSSTATSLKTGTSEVILLDDDVIGKPQEHVLQGRIAEFLAPYLLPYSQSTPFDGAVSECSTSDLGSELYDGRCYSADDEADGENVAKPARLNINFTDWIKGSRLGQGSFGVVYEGISRDGHFFAVQEVSFLQLGSLGRNNSVPCIEREIEMLSSLQHKNIVCYYGTALDDANIYIFSELATKGSLVNLYRQFALPDSVVSAYTRQILLGLIYLHSRFIAHRDIKCANILLSSTRCIKLAGFALAKLLLSSADESNLSHLISMWMAPENVWSLVYCRERDGIKADIWSLGCTVLELATRQLPYHPLEVSEAMDKIVKCEPPPVPEHLSTDLRDFISKCLQANPSARPSAAEMLDHPFVKRPSD